MNEFCTLPFTRMGCEIKCDTALYIPLTFNIRRDQTFTESLMCVKCEIKGDEDLHDGTFDIHHS